MESIQSAINAYFLGERTEMILIILGSVMVSTCIVLLNRRYQLNLIKAISWSVSASGLLLSVTAISLLFRDAELRNTLYLGYPTVIPSSFSQQNFNVLPRLSESIVFIRVSLLALLFHLYLLFFSLSTRM